MKSLIARYFQASRRPYVAMLFFGALATTIATPALGSSAERPADFQPYGTADLGGGLRCVVGEASTGGEDGPERAFVYVEDTSSHEVKWVASVPVPKGWYQNRASHCVADEGKVYALIQSDTNAVPVMSQTFISIVALDKHSGHLESDTLVKVPGLKGAHTFFVYEGAEHFREAADGLVVVGEYASKGDPAETRKPFTVTMPMSNMSPQGKAHD